MKFKNFVQCLVFVVASFYVSAVFAVDDMGQVAVNILQPVSVIGDFVNTACLVLGGAFVFTSFIRYMEHRRSPLVTPISTVIFLFVAGLVLIAIPFLFYLTGNGLPFSLMSNGN